MTMDKITDTIMEYLPLLAPLIIIQLALIVAALLDLRARANTRGPRWLWVVIIVFVNMIGPILYFVIAREDE
jgi:hypothetical protein